MEINKKSVDGLCSLPDDELRRRIKAAAGALGADPDKIPAELTDMSTIKRKLSSLSDRQIKAICGALGEERLNRIMKAADDGRGQ